MNLPPHLQNISGMMFPNNSNIQLNNLSAQNGINPSNNVFTNDLIKITGMLNKYKIFILLFFNQNV